MNKKLLSVLTALVLIIGLFLTGCKKTAQIKIEKQTVSSGDTFTVPVLIENNPGFMATALRIEYDPEKLEYQSFQSGDLLKSIQFTQKENTLCFFDVENEDIKKDGILLYLNFTAKPLSASDKTELKVNVGKEDFCNYNEEFIEVKGCQSEIVLTK